MMITVIFLWSAGLGHNRKQDLEMGAASWLRGALSRSCFPVDSILITSGTDTDS